MRSSPSPERPAPSPPPVPLVALMPLALLLSVTWTLVTPAFQAPDEQSHFAYTQLLGETVRLPGDAAKPIYSAEHIRAPRRSTPTRSAAQPLTPPEWSERLERRWRSDHGARTLPATAAARSSASSYPPLSYLWQSAGYRLFASGDFFDKLFGARLFSALWLPVTVLGTWLLAGELFGRRRVLQLRGRRGAGAAADAGLHLRLGEPGRDALRDLDAGAVARGALAAARDAARHHGSRSARSSGSRA